MALKHVICDRLLAARSWQPRPQLDELTQWYRSCSSPGQSAGSIAALVGIGGAGKTAIAERFTWVVPGVRNPRQDMSPLKDLKAPAASLVFSFYAKPNAEAFFAVLDGWIQERRSVKRAKKTKSHKDVIEQFKITLDQLSREDQVLLVLDGLERIQDTSHRSTFGELEDKTLTRLFDDIADGDRAFARLLIVLTTRISVASLDEGKRPFYKRIDVSKLETETAMALLRARGVDGNDSQVRRLAGRCGLHALTVDLAGGFIGEFGNGDPETRLTLPSVNDLNRLIQDEPDPARREILKQELRLARLSSHYAKTLQQKDPAALALLQRLAIFRLGMSAERLARIFTGHTKTTVSPPALAKLDKDAVEKRMRYLANLHLIDYDSLTRTASIHPAVRDGFLRSMRSEQIAEGHKAAKTVLYADLNLGEAPDGLALDDAKTLDLLEELIFHLVELNDTYEAIDIYKHRLGGFERLGRELGEFSRGERICTLLLQALESKMKRKRNDQGRDAARVDLYSDRCSFRMDLEDRDALGDADILVKLTPIANPHSGPVLSILNASIIHERFGKYRVAMACIRAHAETLASTLEWERAKYEFDANRIAVKCLLVTGDLAGAKQSLLNALLQLRRRTTWLRPAWYTMHTFAHDRVKLLVALGKLCQAERVLRSTGKDFASRLPKRRQRHPAATCCGDLATILIYAGKLAEARASLDYLADPLGKGDPDLETCVTVRGRLALAAASRGTLDAAQIQELEQGKHRVDKRLREVRRLGDSGEWIDLLVVRARLHLRLGSTSSAIRDCKTALFGASRPVGPHSEFDQIPAREETDDSHLAFDPDLPSADRRIQGMSEADDPRATFATPESGFPNLLGATHAQCRYKLGEWEARTVLAETLLAEVATLLGKDYISNGDLESNQLRSAASLIDQARRQLHAVLRGRDEWKHPIFVEARYVLDKLNAGRLVVPTPSRQAATETLEHDGEAGYAAPLDSDPQIPSTKRKERALMPTHQFNARRLKQVEDLLDIEYDKYHEFEKEISTSDGASRIQLKLEFKRDVTPRLCALEEEYATILVAGVPSAKIPEAEAGVLVSELLHATDAILNAAPANAPQEMLRLLGEIKAKLGEPKELASAKLKISLPLVPTICSYEMELETGEMMNNVWRQAKAFFKGLVSKRTQE